MQKAKGSIWFSYYQYGFYLWIKILSSKIQLVRLIHSYRWLLSFYLVCLICSFSYAQSGFKGKILDKNTNEPLAGAILKIGDKGGLSDLGGFFEIQLNPGIYLAEINYLGYEPKAIDLVINPGSWRDTTLFLDIKIGILGTAIISDSRYNKPLAESSVSIEVLKRNLIDHLNTTSVDEILDKVPGVNMIGDQANIRGGSGFSYGAGSRVLLMVNEVPALQADAGYPNWDDIPIENIEQIEVIKGASSAIYGSSALNGLIHVRTAYARSEPVTKLSIFYNPVLAPKDKSQQWWTDAPYTSGLNLSHSRKLGKWDLILGGYAYHSKSYNQTSKADYQRFNGSIQYRITDRLSVGTHFNFNNRKSSSFFYWRDGVHAFYRPDSLTLSNSNSFRFHVDPFVTYFDANGNKHSLRSRVYVVDNTVSSGQSNSSTLIYNEYQFQKKWGSTGLITTMGAVFAHNQSNSELFNRIPFNSDNLAAFVQAEKKFKAHTTLSFGWRIENFRLHRPEFFSGDTLIGGVKKEVRNLFRVGLNSKLSTATYLRASWGQGFRFPTLAEQFITTTFGSTFISPNPKLQSERGWTTEIGIKQGYKINEFQGYFDVALFWSKYRDMMEFVFTGFVKGFQSQNIGNTDIKGYELTTGGGAALGKHQWSVIGGYTFINPRFENFTEEDNRRSSADFNILKYRSKHLFKLDIEDEFSNWIIGTGVLYTSKMEAIDAVFELVINGLKSFRSTHGGYTVFDFRLARKWKPFTINLILKNMFNEEYSSRPALMDAPRNLTFRIDYKI